MATTEPAAVFERELYELTGALLEGALIDDQNFVYRRTVGNKADATQVVVLESGYWTESDVGVLSSTPYSDLHARLTSMRAYDLRFLDGGLAQFRFEFEASGSQALQRARLAYLPSPDLTPFQQDPAVYLGDEVFGDVVDVRAVTTPLRFDYDAREDVAVEVHHPVAHVTLGQYPHCRIALAGPISPYYFIEFVVRSFYRTKTSLPTEALPGPRFVAHPTITEKERSLVHFGLPTAP